VQETTDEMQEASEGMQEKHLKECKKQVKRW
jgi:hypothetical protein